MSFLCNVAGHKWNGCSCQRCRSSSIILETLKLSVDSLGIFSAFDVFTRNAGAALDIIYSLLDQLDAARETGKRNSDEQSTDTEKS